MKVWLKNIALVFLAAVLVVAMLSVLAYVAFGSIIGYSVRRSCDSAQAQYGGDCIEALLVLTQDTSASFHQRNQAIWSLGQLGDVRANPVLAKMYTGVPAHREPLDEVISQYEIKKALALTSGSTNITAFVWRHPFSSYAQQSHQSIDN